MELFWSLFDIFENYSFFYGGFMTILYSLKLWPMKSRLLPHCDTGSNLPSAYSWALSARIESLRAKFLSYSLIYWLPDFLTSGSSADSWWSSWTWSFIKRPLSTSVCLRFAYLSRKTFVTLFSFSLQWQGSPSSWTCCALFYNLLKDELLFHISCPTTSLMFILMKSFVFGLFYASNFWF